MDNNDNASTKEESIQSELQAANSNSSPIEQIEGGVIHLKPPLLQL